MSDTNDRRTLMIITDDRRALYFYSKNRIEQIVKCFSDKDPIHGKYERYRKGVRVNYSRGQTLLDFTPKEILRYIYLRKNIYVPITARFVSVITSLNQYLSPDEVIEFFQLIRGRNIEDLNDFVEGNMELTNQVTEEDFHEALALIQVKEILNS